MARTLARYDLAEASAYYRARKQCGLIGLHGSAAPLRYRVACRVLGFRGAEKLASAIRGGKPIPLAAVNAVKQG